MRDQHLVIQELVVRDLDLSLALEQGSFHYSEPELLLENRVHHEGYPEPSRESLIRVVPKLKLVGLQAGVNERVGNRRK